MLAVAASLSLVAACGPGRPTASGSAPPLGKSELIAELALRSGGDGTCTPAPLADRAARTLLVGLPGASLATDPLVQEVLDVGVGGVLLTHANVEAASQVRALTASIRSRAGRPIVIATDEEPGRVSSFAALFGALPSARRLAGASTVEGVRALARELGGRLAYLGITVDLAPVADLDSGPAFGLVGDRSFSADPGVASRYALAWARGLADAGVTPVTKHFPGHGRTPADTHVADADVSTSLAELKATDLRPFADTVAAGAPAIMLGHVSYNALQPGMPASMAPRAYELLRGLGFEGAAITDSIGMGAVNLRWDFDEAAVRAISAGADGVLATDGNQARRMRDALVSAVRTGRLAESRLDQAAARMAALGGDDPYPLTCLTVRLPSLTPSR